jgi:hypothetical protein
MANPIKELIIIQKYIFLIINLKFIRLKAINKLSLMHLLN